MSRWTGVPMRLMTLLPHVSPGSYTLREQMNATNTRVYQFTRDGQNVFLLKADSSEQLSLACMCDQSDLQRLLADSLLALDLN